MGLPPAAERLTSKIRVRLLEPEDSLAHLTGLLHRAYKVHAEAGLHALAGFQPEEVTRRRIEGGECYVAAYLGRVVGTILFRDAAATRGAWPMVGCAQDGCASFSQLAVEPEYQGKGIGTELMGMVERRGAATGASRIALSTPEPATWLVEMYQRHGYRIVERRHWDETNYVSAIMSKGLVSPGDAT